MSKGFTGVGNSGARSGNSFIVRSALILSILAFILIVLLSLTVYSSNRLMNIEKTEASNVPANILPSYSTTSFESADGQTALQGWFFKTKDPISTIIVTHSSGSNRLPFGVEMIDMIESWLDSGYNVFMFDLRNSGTSSGDICGYGYLEWQDVLGAISIVKQISVTTDVILYGIGTGCTAQLIAYDQLPDAGITDAELNSYPDAIRELDFDKSYIVGMIFDSPAKTSDDYIRPLVAQNEVLGIVTQFLVPYAIRVSSSSENINLAAEIARLPMPVLIIYGGHDTFIGADKITQLVNERNRLNSAITSSAMISGAGYLEEYTLNKTEYISVVTDYLNSFFMVGE
ncbi:MAG: lysophospholipase [Saccharofermentans sp.]|nr:lysophospholipase [Saccharofermentans sp.]